VAVTQCIETRYADDGMTVTQADDFTLTPWSDDVDIAASYLDAMTAQVRQWGQTPTREGRTLTGRRDDGSLAFQLIIKEAV
jgi:hypothetical protein